MSKPFRLVGFFSHAPGFNAFKEMLKRPEEFELALVVTDNPDNPECKAKRRLWRHGEVERMRRLVPDLAADHNIPVYDGAINDPKFVERFAAIKPRGILCSCFGQKLSQQMLNVVQGRAFNIHPCIPGKGLEATRLANPIGRALDANADALQHVMHKMTARFDDGEIVARGDLFRFPPDLAAITEKDPEFHQRRLAFDEAFAKTVASIFECGVSHLFAA